MKWPFKMKTRQVLPNFNLETRRRAGFEPPEWLVALERDGYAVVPNVLDAATVAELKVELRKNILEFTREAVDLDDPTTYAKWSEAYPMHSMLVQHSGIGHVSALWAIRQDPRVAAVFATLWGFVDFFARKVVYLFVGIEFVVVDKRCRCSVEDLLVSFDALSIHLAPEYRKSAKTDKSLGWFKNPWWHTDQGPATPGDCVQGLVTLNDVGESDATLTVLRGSHEHWREYFLTFPPKAGKEGEDWHRCTSAEQVEWFKARGCVEVAVPMGAGAVALWNSKTFHFGREPLEGRVTPVNRLVAYVCYVPRYRPTTPADERWLARVLARRVELLKLAKTARHNPLAPAAFGDEARTYCADKKAAVARVKPFPEAELSALGRRLVGFDK